MPSGIQIVRSFYPEVTKVVNSKKPITIKVTRNDSSLSRKKSHKACAMASACKRQLDIDAAIISTRTAYLIKGDVAMRYEVPESVAREIISFDRGAGFAPGEYILNKYVKKATRGAGTGHGPSDRPAGVIRHNKRTTGIRASLATV